MQTTRKDYAFRTTKSFFHTVSFSQQLKATTNDQIAPLQKHLN